MEADRFLEECIAAVPEWREVLLALATDAADATALDPRQRVGGGSATNASPSISGFEVIHELGRGGMGVVYKARQVQLNRAVALKMILAGAHAGPQEVRRFLNEAEAVARLQHPNIVQVHESGQYQGLPYFSMELVSGGSLASRLRGTPLSPQAAATAVRQLARAIHHAHSNGIIHRDLKPANILLHDECDTRLQQESNSNDHPGLGPSPCLKITDFGLARRLEVSPGLTASGAVIGTPSYMAPEQASGRANQAGPAADIYSLGAILYELLTGRPPFKAATAMETILQVVEHDPVSPRLVNPGVDRDLEAVCLKCLQKNPADRYGSADELTEDLSRYLNGDPVSARRLPLLGHLGRTIERGRYREELRNWSGMLICFAAIILPTHALVFWLSRFGPPYHWNWLLRFAQVLLLVLCYWGFQRTLLPSTPAQRQLFAIWVGYVLVWVFIRLASQRLAGSERAVDEITLYPTYSIVAALGFFAMGESYTGRCYSIGMMFLVLGGIVMPWDLTWAPLEFGLLWAGSLLALAWHLSSDQRSLGR